jgi:hypothetical protein
LHQRQRLGNIYNASQSKINNELQEEQTTYTPTVDEDRLRAVRDQRNQRQSESRQRQRPDVLSIAVDDSDELVAHDRHALYDLIEIPTPDQMKSFETDPIAAQHLFWETSRDL